MTAEELFKTLVEMPGGQWFLLTRAVGNERNKRWAAAREKEADILSQSMDMTPEGYVKQWAAHGGRTHEGPLHAWEHAYQRADIIELAYLKGYIEIGRDVNCTITLTEKGKALVS